MFKNPKARRRLTVCMAIVCCLAMAIGTLAFFTDRVSMSIKDQKAGTLDLVFRDISASKTGTNGITSTNQFAIDKAWTNGAIVSAPNINPGDYFDLSYKLANVGNKSMDVRQQLTLTSTVPMTATEGFKLTVTGQDYNTTAVAGTLSDDGYSITYELDDILLNGTGDGAETEDGITWTEQAYTVRLEFAGASGNEFQGSGVSICLDSQAKQHKNTDDSIWVEWANYETEIGKTDGGITVSATNSEGVDLNASANEISGSDRLDLLTKLENSGLVDSATNVDALIEVESDDFDDLATTTFNVSSIADAGDTVIILHFNEATQEWEYISQETVDADGNVTADFERYSPVAFVVVKADGTTEIIGGSGDGSGGSTVTYVDFTVTADNRSEIGFKDEQYEALYIPATFEGSDGTMYRVVAIGDSAFEYCGGLDSVTIPDSVTSIGASAFKDCDCLGSVTIPDSVTSIGASAFKDCDYLGSVTIPDSVTSIGASTFAYCDFLGSITIPDSVTSIGDAAFFDCGYLESVNYAGTESQWAAIEIGDSNEALTSATINYNYAG